MAKEIYKWDLEGLKVNKDRLKEEKEKLMEQKSFLENLKGEIETNWRSISSRIYLEDLETDTENMTFIIQALEELTGKLEQIIVHVYEACETEIRTGLTQLSSSITSI